MTGELSPGELSRLALGTAQLGMDYGIANVAGKPDRERTIAIVAAAWEDGINCFDTAQSYGESEALLGMAFSELGLTDKAMVVTKPAPALEDADNRQIFHSVETSLNAVGVPSFYGLLLHRQDWLVNWEAVHRRRLAPLAEAGLVRHFGVSIYDTDSFEVALKSPGIDLIEAPFNIFDQRADRLRWFEKARDAGKVIMVRSVFLQGLALTDPDKLPAGMGFAREALTDFREACAKMELAPIEACLGYVLTKAEGAVIIFGAETPEQVRQAAAVSRRSMVRGFPAELFDGLGQPQDSPIIDPRLWPSTR